MKNKPVVRDKRIGGSDAPAILGFSPWKSAFQLWLEKTGREKEDMTKESHPWLYWGRVLEPVIAEEYSVVTGEELIECDRIIHPHYDWLAGTPDRLIAGKNKILECKIAREARANKDWGIEKDAVKLPYIIQVQHYMALADADSADIAVLIGNSDFRIYTIPRDDKLIQIIIDKCGFFYKNYIEKDMAPPVLTGKDALYFWPKDNGKYKEVESGDYLTCQEYKLLREEKKKLEEMMQKISDKIKIKMKDLAGWHCEGKKVATYKVNSRGSRVLLIK